jgi:hypothetical protein
MDTDPGSVTGIGIGIDMGIGATLAVQACAAGVDQFFPSLAFRAAEAVGYNSFKLNNL